MKIGKYLLLLPLIIIVWARLCVQAPFLWDDEGIIVTNYFTGTLKSIQYLFNKDYFTVFHELSYRPVVTLSHILDTVLWHINPLAHHLTNLLFHIFNAVLVYLICRKITQNRLIHITAPLLFAVYPLHLETLGVVAYRDDILMAFFFLMAYNAYLNIRNKPSFVSYITFFIGFLLSLFAKETALVFMAMLVMGDLWCFTEKKTHLWLYCATVLLTVLYGTVRFYFMSNPEISSTAQYFSTGIPFFLRPVLVFGTALRMGFLPFNVILDYNSKPLLYWLSAQGWCVGILLIIIFYKKLNTVSAKLGLLFMLLPFIPACNIYPLENFFANRYAYLSCVGFALVWSNGITVVCRRRNISIAIYTVLIGLFVLFCLYGSKYFVSQKVFAEKMVADNAKNYKALNYLGTICMEDNKIDCAQKYYEQALSVNPDFFESCYNLASVYIRKARFDSARPLLNHIISLNPNRSQGYRLWGDMLMEQGKPQSALRFYRQALVRNRYDLDAANNLGTIYEQLDRLDEAARLYRSIIKMNPRSDSAWANLGNVNIKQAQYQLAEQCYLESLSINNSNALTWYNLGNAYFYRHQWKQAEQAYLQSTAYNPAFPDPLYNLAVVYITTGKRQSAIDMLERYMKLNPNDSQAQNQLNILKQQN